MKKISSTKKILLASSLVILPALVIIALNLLTPHPASADTATSLAKKDTSGTFKAKADETEVVADRTESFKKFRLPDTTDGRAQYRIGGQVGPIHYKLDDASTTESYKEIDLTVLPCSFLDQFTKANCSIFKGSPDYHMDTNGYQVHFWNDYKQGSDNLLYVAQFWRDGHWLKLNPIALVYENDKGEQQLISEVKKSKTAPIIDNNAYTITWKNVFGPGLDFRYNLSPDKFFKTVIVNKPEDLPKATIDPQGLKITVVLGIAWDPTTKLGNDFASSTVIDQLPAVIPAEAGIQTPFDEVLNNPHEFPTLDPNTGRQVWWLHQPKAWDSGDTATTTDGTPGARQEFPMDWTLKRQGHTAFADVSLPAATLNNPSIVYPFYIDTAIPEEQVGASADDVTAWGGGYAGASLIYGFCRVGKYSMYGNNYYNGLRFQTVPLAQAAIIESASISIQFSSSYGNTALVKTKIVCQNSDNADAFVGTQGDVDGRPKTTNVVTWDDYSGLTNVGTYYSSPDIASCVQTVVNRQGWVANNNLVVIWGDYSNLSTSPNYWQGNSYDTSGNVSGPKFNAIYTAAAPSFVAGVSVGASTVPDSYFSGQIDEVRLSNRALSATEAKQLYNLGKAVIGH